MPKSTDTPNDLFREPGDSSLTTNHIVAKHLLTDDNQQPTMSSREIADLLDARHDNVRRTIERLADRGVIVRPPLEDEHDQDAIGRPRATSVYRVGKRDSYVVVAQLSPEFTGRLVDRWQQLEGERDAPQFQTKAQPKVDVARECRLTLSQNLKLAKMMGLSGNQALLSANRATVAMTGIDTLRLMGATHITAPQNEALLSPSDIGVRAGIGSARAVNKRLCDLGLQQQYRDGKGHAYYEPTAIGRELGGVLQDTGKRHSTGTPVRQLRWASSIIRQVQEPDHRPAA